MALKAKSLLLFGLQVTELNRSLDFKRTSGGPTLQATLRLGYYSLSGLMVEVSRAMQEVDTANTYTVSANRTISGGTENRVTIATSGAFLSLMFGSGPRAASSVAPLLGFLSVDYVGSTSYTGITTCGTALIPDFVGYNYIEPDFQPKVFGAVNVSASGLKEAIVFQIQKFIGVQFKYESRSRVISYWVPFIEWAIQQRAFDFTPEVTSPTIVYEVTLDSTQRDGKGLGFFMKEQLPDFPDEYDTGPLVLRLTPQ